MTGTQTITAIAGSLSGSTTATVTTVNIATSYKLSITISNALTSAGQVKVVFPSILSIASSTSCASLSGSNMAVGPTCAYTALDNSITFTGLNSSTNNIPAQTFNLTVNGITNPPSIKPTDGLTVTTFYSSGSGQVDSGTVTGVTSTKASIDHTKASISSNSLVNSATGVTYSISFEVKNPIPAGGYIRVLFPSQVTFETAAASSSCQISLNNGSSTSTSCTASFSSPTYTFNFTNPLTA